MPVSDLVFCAPGILNFICSSCKFMLAGEGSKNFWLRFVLYSVLIEVVVVQVWENKMGEDTAEFYM